MNDSFFVPLMLIQNSFQPWSQASRSRLCASVISGFPIFTLNRIQGTGAVPKDFTVHAIFKTLFIGGGK